MASSTAPSTLSIPPAAGGTAAPAQPPVALFALGNLVIGTGAFVLAGIVGDVAKGLGVSVAGAGQGMTAYALATALLAPLALVLTGRLRRRSALLLALGLVAAGNLVCALATSLPMLYAGRVLMGVGAMYTPLVAGLTVAGVDAQQRGRALSFVFLGISLSYVVGLPFGTWLAAHDSWRLPIEIVAVAAVAMMALLFARLPADVHGPGATFKGAGALLRQPEVAGPLALTFLYIAATFVMFAYIGPVLHALGPLTPGQVSLTLLVVGVAGVVGTLLGGWAADRIGAVSTLRIQLAVFLVAQLALPLAAGRPVLLVALFFVWGVAGFGMMAPQQARLASVSAAHAPLLLSLNASMLYLATAAGAALGGALSTRIGFGQLAWAGAPFIVAGLLLASLSRR